MNDKTKNDFINMISHELLQKLYLAVKNELDISDEEEIMNVIREVVSTMDNYVDLTLERIKLSKEINKSADEDRKTPDIGDDFGI